MVELLSKIRKQLNIFWQKTNTSQKAKIGVVFITLLTSIILFFTVIAKPNYVPLFSDLSLSDSGEIIDRLDEMKIPYRLTGNGQTIEVPSEDVYRTRMELAQEGLPKGGIIGFSDILERNKIGTTDWERRLQYNQALQGELARTIQGIKGVEETRIHIVVPEKSLFINPDEEETASAAIFLKLKPTTNLSVDQVRGILYLVSNSVEGLKPENITIIDDKGRLLSNSLLLDENSNIGFDSQSLKNQFEIQQNFQKHLESNVKTLLEQVFGVGNVAVRINAQLDFNQEIVESKLFQPVVDDQGILRSIQQMEEHFSGSSQPGAEGPPGTTSNIGPPGYEEIDKGQSEYSKTETTKNFEVNEILKTLKVAPGSVKKMTVSVVVNKQLNDEEKSEVAQLVENAIGYDSNRDKISVEGIVFNTSLQEEISKQIEAEKTQYKSLLNKSFIAGSLLLGLIIIFLYRWAINRRKQRTEMETAFTEQSSSVENISDKLAEKSNVLKEVEKLSRRQPENVAQILKTWLNED